MRGRIFKDDVLQTLFNRQGYVVAPFISTGEVKLLDELFDSLHPSLPKEGFVSSSYSQNYAYKKKASDEIVKIFSKHYERLFQNYQPFGAAFLFKIPSPNSQLAVHQDWTIVDEEKFVALNCWVPLIDADEKNGTLHIIPGSHYDAIKSLRAPTLPFFFTGDDDLVVEQCIPLHVKAGEAVILDQSIIHFSPPNISSKIRKAITAGVKTKGAPMHFHYFNAGEKEEEVEVFEMPEDFLLNFQNFYTDISKRPQTGKSIGWKKYEAPKFKRADLKTELVKLKANAGHINIARKNFFQRVAEVFQ